MCLNPAACQRHLEEIRKRKEKPDVFRYRLRHTYKPDRPGMGCKQGGGLVKETLGVAVWQTTAQGSRWALCLMPKYSVSARRVFL